MSPAESARRKAIWLSTGLAVVGAMAGFQAIRVLGAGLTASAPSAGTPAAHATAGAGSLTLHVLLALLTILVASRGLGFLLARLGQPSVIGEMLAGILLGPSLLGSLAPGVAAQIFPPSVIPSLGLLAQIGVLLFMFVIGLELDARSLRQEAEATLAISVSSILTPFLLASGLALWLYPMVATRDVAFTTFALFMGVSMSVTAFPVLARILQERGLKDTALGAKALTCAAVGDALAWCLLAFVVGVAQSDVSGAVMTVFLSAAYLAVMFIVVRPLAARFARHYEERAGSVQAMMGAVCVVLLLSSLATELIGIHTLFGAFLIGAVIPHDSRVARELRARVQDVVVVLFLPAFFAYSGLRTRFDLIRPEQWWICAAIIGVACLGKFGGGFVAARLTGSPWRTAAALGILMNTRGLVELIVLNVGLDLKVISPELFSMLVMMALVTTVATTPILDRLIRPERQPLPAEATKVPLPP